VGSEAVLYRQLVQPELAGDGVELFPGRLVKIELGEAALLAAGLFDLFERTGSIPMPVHVDGTVHDHDQMIRPPRGDDKAARRAARRAARKSANACV